MLHQAQLDVVVGAAAEAELRRCIDSGLLELYTTGEYVRTVHVKLLGVCMRGVRTCSFNRRSRHAWQPAGCASLISLASVWARFQLHGAIVREFLGREWLLL
jgi:hypothetical protein